LAGKTLIFGNGTCARHIAQQLTGRGIEVIVVTNWATQNKSLDFKVSSTFQGKRGKTPEVLTGARLVSCKGSAGNFSLLFADNGEKISRTVATIIVAEEEDRKPDFLLYGIIPSPNVISLSELAQSMNNNQIVGNVLALVTNKKSHNNDAEIVAMFDYYPFGMEIPRNDNNSLLYRYGFNGYEHDDEIKGRKNSYYTFARFYDPRIARWLSVDPIYRSEKSTYQSFNNNPIYYVDITGEQEGHEVEGESEDFEAPVFDFSKEGMLNLELDIDLNLDAPYDEKEALLTEIGLLGQIAEILSVLPYKRPSKLSNEGKFVDDATQCVSFTRMALSIFVDETTKPRKTGTSSPGRVFGELLKESVKKRTLISVNYNTRLTTIKIPEI